MVVLFGSIPFQVEESHQSLIESWLANHFRATQSANSSHQRMRELAAGFYKLRQSRAAQLPKSSVGFGNRSPRRNWLPTEAPVSLLTKHPPLPQRPLPQDWQHKEPRSGPMPK
jgi:hypothetical protein